MIVRCGSCRTQFEVPGPGRYSCPMCGSVNAVRAAGSTPPPQQMPGMPGQPPMPPPEQQRPAPPPAPEPPSPKIGCPECGFSFIVGDIDVATCPNCGAEVETGLAEDGDEE
jgi:Zn finger protein HypA/HybF involved in hydrogenase expression